MKRQTRQPSSNPMPSWDSATWGRVAAGRYQAAAVRVQGPQWVRRYRRWSLLLEFELLSGDGIIPCFFNMGTNPEKPHAGPQSRYFKAWAMAHGELPTKGQKLDAAEFMDGQIYLLEIADSETDSEGSQKDESLLYSRVSRILGVECSDRVNQPISQSPQSGNHPNQLIHDSGIKQSHNQESTNQVLQCPSEGVEALPVPGGGQTHTQLTQSAGEEAAASIPAQATGSQSPPAGKYHEVFL